MPHDASPSANFAADDGSHQHTVDRALGADDQDMAPTPRGAHFDAHLTSTAPGQDALLPALPVDGASDKRSYDTYQHFEGSPRSRTSSFASRSSAFDSIATGSTDTNEYSTPPSFESGATALHPSSDESGFLVELVEKREIYGCSWGELARLLTDPATTSHLPTNHLIFQVSEFIKAQLAQPPDAPLPFDRPTTMTPEAMPHMSTGFESLAVGSHAYGAHASRWDDDRSIKSSASFPAYSAASTRPDDANSLHSFRPSGDSLTRSNSSQSSSVEGSPYLTPLQQAFLSGGSQQHHQHIRHDAPSHSVDQLPARSTTVPAEDWHAGHEQYQARQTSVPTGRVGGSSGTRTVRESRSRPYPSASYGQQSTATATGSPFRATSDPYSSDGRSFDGSGRGSGGGSSGGGTGERQSGGSGGRSGSGLGRPGHYFDATQESQHRLDQQDELRYQPRQSGTAATRSSSKPLKSLNRETEHYIWKHELGQLFRVSPGAKPGAGEVLTFPPESYYRVYKDDLEILPSDPAPRSNDWIRAQVCVPDCVNFRMSGKRPATIRHHFTQCRLREYLGEDPLARLCQLQILAGKQMKEQQRQKDMQGCSSSSSSAGYAYGTRPASIRSNVSGWSAEGSANDDEVEAENAEYTSYERFNNASAARSVASVEQLSSGEQEPDAELMDQDRPEEQALIAMMQSSSSSNASTSTEGGGDGGGEVDDVDDGASEWHAWLATQGLNPDRASEPESIGSSQRARASVYLPEAPIEQNDSFLSMDEG